MIVESDAFLDMPISSQALYFHLCMNADDDGFVNPKKIMRLIGAAVDDLNVLLTKRFALKFENGVIVIKHWLIHNSIRKDRYHETIYAEEKKLLKVKENGAYTEVGNQMATSRHLKLSKAKVSEAKSPASGDGKEVNEIIFLFKEVNPMIEKYYGRDSERKAIERMLKQFGREKLEGMIASLPKINGQKYWPKSTTPIQLENNIAHYIAKRSELVEKQIAKTNKMAIMPTKTNEPSL